MRSLASGVRRVYQSERSGDLIKLRNFVQRMQMHVLVNLNTRAGGCCAVRLFRSAQATGEAAHFSYF